MCIHGYLLYFMVCYPYKHLFKIIKWSFIDQWAPLKPMFLLHVLLMLFYTNFFLLLHI